MYFFAKVAHSWLKWSLTRDCRLQVFSRSRFPPWPLGILLGPFQIFMKICGDLRNLVFTAGVNNIGDKLVHRCKRHQRYIYYPLYLFTGDKLSPVSSIHVPVIKSCRFHDTGDETFAKNQLSYTSQKSLYECKLQSISISKIWTKPSYLQKIVIYRQCRWHRWLTFTIEYLREFS